MSYVLKRTVSSVAEASLCRRDAGEKGKESARSTMGKRKRGSSRLFPLSIVPRAPSVFRFLFFLLGYPASVINSSTVFSTFDLDKLGKIQPHHWKEHIKIIEFKSDNYVLRERRYNVCKFSQLWGTKSATVFNKSFSNSAAILLIQRRSSQQGQWIVPNLSMSKVKKKKNKQTKMVVFRGTRQSTQ